MDENTLINIVVAFDAFTMHCVHNNEVCTISLRWTSTEILYIVYAFFFYSMLMLQEKV